VSVHMLCHRPHLVVGEAPERVALKGSAGVGEVVCNDLIRIDATLAPGELVGGGSSHFRGRCHGLGGAADIGNGGIHWR
jgi:hypothetical protein